MYICYNCALENQKTCDRVHKQIFMKNRFILASTGCRTNQYEVQALRSQLEKCGWQEAEDGQRADLCIINTCSVTAGAESSSRRMIRGFIKAHPGARVVVTGCLAKRDRSALESIEGVTDVIESKEHLIEQVLTLREVVPFTIDRFAGQTRAFLKVQDGCNNFCSYCVIPYLRGESRSRSMEEIIEEAKVIIASGHKEIVVTGIDVGDFKDGEHELSDLLRKLDALSGLHRLRVSSINPDQVDEKMVETIVSGKNTCPSMHLVLQSGSNTVLERMRRRYTAEMFLEKVNLFRERCPDFMFTTDVIVGFPGETDEDFEKTCSLVEAVRFSKVHVFPYSQRPNTRACRYTDTVASSLISERKTRLIELSEQIATSIRKEYIGREVEVLTEESADAAWLSGQTRNGLVVRLERDGHGSNELLQTCICGQDDTSLIAKV